MSETKKEISKSKAKRLAQENARKEQKKKKALSVFLTVMIPLVIVAVIVGIYIGYKNSILDYSRYLAADGTVANIKIEDYVTTTYESMSFNKADLLPDDSTVDSDIQAVLTQNAELKKDATLSVVSGNKVNIIYDATVSGVPYASVSENAGGYDMTIGSASISSDVDDALLGKCPGDVVSVNVARVNTDDAGNQTTTSIDYEITLIGIYVNPELTDEFVQTTFPEYASAESYRNSIIDSYYDSNLETAIRDSLSMNCVVSGVPAKYLENTKKIIAQLSKDNYDYYSQLYAQYGLSMGSLYEMYGCANQAEFDAYLDEQAYEQASYVLSCQAIFEKAGLTNTSEEVKAYYLANGVDEVTYNENIKQYGFNYVANNAMTGRVIEYLKNTVTVVE